MTLARGLSPAYLRFGGKRTDFLQFHNLKNLAKFRGPGPDYYLKNYEDGDYSLRTNFRSDSQEGECAFRVVLTLALIKECGSFPVPKFADSLIL